MYQDVAPCAVCGASVRLEARDGPAVDDAEPVGPVGGVVGTADGPVDARVCTNDDCPTNSGTAEAPTP